MPGLTHYGVVEGLRAAVYWIARLWFRGVFYGRTLRGRRPRALVMVPEENWPGSSDSGVDFIDGRFRFLNQTVSADDIAIGRINASLSWQAEYHSFDWLRDLRAIGTERARLQARTYLTDWITKNQKWDPISWRPDILARRVCNWLTHAEFISTGADWGFVETFLDQIARQVRHLRRAGRFVPDGIDQMLVNKALIYAALCLPGGIRFVPKQLKISNKINALQILPDGGHIDRSPTAQLQAMRYMIDIRSALNMASVVTPEPLKLAIQRATPMLKFFRHGDAKFALFNGSTESDPTEIDLVLSKAGTTAKTPTSAQDTGFERVEANRTLLIVDCAGPPSLSCDAHAGALSFEMSVGKQRVIVNCGASARGNEAWSAAQRATAAHSTLVVDDRNSFEIRTDGISSARNIPVTAERRETEGNTWLDMCHHGYLASHGIIHNRRIYINSSGTDIRGEDVLNGTGDHKFSIRFHLHPSVKASVLQNRASVLLRLPNKSGWRMRWSGGIANLQESIYFADGKRTKRTEQIVISGATQQGAAQIKWALTKLKTG